MRDPQAFYDPREQMVFSDPVSKSPTNKGERTAQLGRKAVKLGKNQLKGKTVCDNMKCNSSFIWNGLLCLQ